MPKFLEDKLKKEYGAKNKAAIYGTMNKLGYMKGNKETAKGKKAQRKHDRKKKRMSKGEAAIRKLTKGK